MAIEVHNEVQMRRYFASYCSCGCCYWIVSSIIILLLPLYIGLLTHDFWAKDALVYEQPEVTFQNKLVLFASGLSLNDDGSTSPLSLAFTTSNTANGFLGGDLRPAIIRSLPTDSNADGRPEEWNIQASLPLQPHETVLSVHMAAFFKFQTHDLGRIQMDGMLALTASNSLAGTGADLSGTVRLQQADRIPATGGYLLPGLGAPVVDLESTTSAGDFAPSTLLKAYAARNFTIALDSPAPAVWTQDAFTPQTPAAVAGGASVAGLNTAPRQFTASLNVRVAPVPIWVRPPMSQVLKGGLVQYLALWFITYMVARFINSFLYGERIISAVRRDDLPGGRKAHMH